MYRTARLVIEPLTHEHADGLLAALDDPRVGAFIGGPDVTTLEALHERIGRLIAGPPAGSAEDRWCNWVVRRADDGVILGRLEATTHVERWAEVAYVFGPAWWGHGYATEGARWMIAHLGAALGIDELWAAVHPGNARSVRLLARLGFEARTPPPRRPLRSYDADDLVFERPA